jgi:hypothetical protein
MRSELHRPDGRLPLLHSLTGGVWTLHALGRPSARSLSMVTPPREDDESLPSAEERHCGLVCTTVRSWEQHELLGASVPLPLL